MLIALGGLPGSGKTTIARALAQRLRAVYLRIDTIEQALRSGEDPDAEIGPAGYIVAYEIAAENLRLGRIVIADSMNPLQITRDSWRDAAERGAANIVEIEVICSDKSEHRRRVETRGCDIAGLKQPTWQEIQERQYEAWDRPPIVVDTAVKAVDDIVGALIDRLGLAAV